MPIAKILGRLLGGGGGGGVEFREFECVDCGSTFQSAKRTERAQCPECLSDDVEVLGTVERS